jgi:uncharacterized protein DUF4192
MGLGGRSGRRLGMCARADIPLPRHAAAVAAELTRSIRTAEPRAVMVAVVSEEPGTADDLPHRALVAHLVRALASADLPVPEILLVRAGRWWSYDCPHPCCHPSAGTPLPRVTELEAAAVAAGTVVEEDRGALEARIAVPRGPAADAMAGTCARVVAECTALARAEGWEAASAGSWTAVTAALQRCRPGPPGVRLTDEDVARVVCGLRDVRVRDRALEFALGPDAAAAELLWTDCTRRAPAPLAAAPATLLAVSAWLRGDGAMANVALSRALSAEPGYGLAELLSEALAACVPPGDLRALLHAASADAFPVG